MAAFDYARPLATADRLIKRFGQDGAIRRSVAGAGDPWNPGVPIITDHPCTLVVLEYTAREIAGTLIQSTDKKVLVAFGGLAVVPTEADQIVVQDRTLEIVNVDTLAPGGVTVLYEIQARA